MFSYVFCDGMKLIQDAICLPLAWPYVDVIVGLWLLLLSEKPSNTSRVVGQQIAKTVLKLFNFYDYNLRGSNYDFQLPLPKTNFLKRSFSYQGAMAWNQLSNETRGMGDLTSFKLAIS